MCYVPPSPSPRLPLSCLAVQPAILMKFLTNVYLAEVTMAMQAKRVFPPLYYLPPPSPLANAVSALRYSHSHSHCEGSCTVRRVPQTQARVPHNFLQNESINEAFRGQLRVVNRGSTEGLICPPLFLPFLHCKCNLQLGLFSVFSLRSSSRDRK